MLGLAKASPPPRGIPCGHDVCGVAIFVVELELLRNNLRKASLKGLFTAAVLVCRNVSPIVAFVWSSRRHNSPYPTSAVSAGRPCAFSRAERTAVGEQCLVGSLSSI